MRLNGLMVGTCLALLAAAPVLAAPAPASDKNATHVDDSTAAKSFVATVLERKGGSLTLQKEGGEVMFLSFDEPGLTVKIDKDVVKGSRVQVTAGVHDHVADHSSSSWRRRTDRPVLSVPRDARRVEGAQGLGRRPGRVLTQDGKGERSARRRAASSSASSGSAPSRFPSFFPSAPTTSGRCAYAGVGSASARWSAICRAVEPRRSAPRTTSVTPCAASSTTTASWYAYGPSARFTTKSPTERETSSEREPKRRSSKVKRPGGTRKRKARAARPGAVRCGTCRDRSRLLAARRRRGGPKKISARARAGVDLFPSKKIFKRPRHRARAGGLKDDLPVPRQAEALERAQDVVGGARHDARRVEVLHAHEPAAALRAREEPRAERGDEAPEVQRPGGGGREARRRAAESARRSRSEVNPLNPGGLTRQDADPYDARPSRGLLRSERSWLFHIPQ